MGVDCFWEGRRTTSWRSDDDQTDARAVDVRARGRDDSCAVAVGHTGREHQATAGGHDLTVVRCWGCTIFNVGRAAPESDEEWLVVRNAAVILAEASNLLMLEGRAKDAEQWMELAGELVASGNDALVAAESQDVSAVLEAGNRIAAACEACHQPYRDGGRAMGPKPADDEPQR